MSAADRRPMIKFLFATAFIGFVAFVLLPWLATLPAVQARIEFHEQRNIDAGATFYTDQPFLTELLLQNEQRQDKDHQ